MSSACSDAREATTLAAQSVSDWPESPGRARRLCFTGPAQEHKSADFCGASLHGGVAEKERL
jgi:hypothetical protein